MQHNKKLFLENLIAKHLTIKRLLILIIIAIYTFNNDKRTSNFIIPGIDSSSSNLKKGVSNVPLYDGIDIGRMITTRYELQKESLELRKANNDLVRKIKVKQKLFQQINNKKSNNENEKHIKVAEVSLNVHNHIANAMRRAIERLTNNPKLFKVYFGGESFTYNEAKEKFQGNFGILNKKNRRPSFPFISGDGFRSICRWRCENRGCGFKPSDVLDGDCIYLASTDLKSFKTTVKYIEEFFKSIFPKIVAKIILIVHNGDLSTPLGDTWHKHEGGGLSVSRSVWEKSFVRYLNDPKILAFAATNCNFEKPNSKIICLPYVNSYRSYVAKFLKYIG